jgi:prefoldin subunit 5
MDTDVREAIIFLEKKIEAIETKIDSITDMVAEIKEGVPEGLDDELSEIKSLLINTM